MSDMNNLSLPEKEPVAIVAAGITALSALFGCFTAFGLHITTEQRDSVLVATGALCMFIIGLAAYLRDKVTPMAKLRAQSREGGVAALQDMLQPPQPKDSPENYGVAPADVSRPTEFKEAFDLQKKEVEAFSKQDEPKDTFEALAPPTKGSTVAPAPAQDKDSSEVSAFNTPVKPSYEDRTQSKWS